MKGTSFESCQRGDFLVTALSDGNMAASLDLLSGINTADARDIQCRAGIVEPGNIHINCYLIRGRGRTLLVDAGTGGLNNAGGLLSENLDALGVAPEDVDTLLITHGHPDHIGGLLQSNGSAAYKNAALYLHPLEAEYWQDDSKLKLASERGQRNFALVRRTLQAYEHKLHLLDGNEIIPGICPVFLPGHTPGHTGFLIDSGGEKLLIWGDIVHFPHIQSAQPGVTILFDCDPAQAEDTRIRVLERVACENWLVAGMHFGRQGFAHVLPFEGGYRLAYFEK